MDAARIRHLIREVRSKYPSALQTHYPQFHDRDVFHIQLAYVPNGRLIDLAGGYSPVSAVLARLGMDVTVVDTFGSTKLYEQFSAEELCDVLQSFGVKLVRADLREYDPAAAFEPNSIDSIDYCGTIASFNPRQLLDRCMPVLKPGGTLVLECNNGVSLVRRLRVLVGRNNTDEFQQYFFHGWHRRFWVKNDVRLLAEYLRLSDRQLLGRNWSAYHSRTLPKWALSGVDHTLRWFPGLCNDIYLVGKKSSQSDTFGANVSLPLS